VCLLRTYIKSIKTYIKLFPNNNSLLKMFYYILLNKLSLFHNFIDILLLTCICSSTSIPLYTGRTVLLRYFKSYINTELKIILLNYQNNYVKCLNVNDNATKSFNILAIFYVFTFYVLHSTF